MIIVLAGRRTDPDQAPTPRFPLAQAARVQQDIYELFMRTKATTLVCSGACGADILALEAAGQAHMARYMLLPFQLSRFRQESVVDRPGAWGQRFDALHAALKAEGKGHVQVFPTMHNLERDLYRLNAKIFEKALALRKQLALPATSASLLAVIVWEGKPRGADDFTATFAEQARNQGIATKEIATLSSVGV